MDGFDHNKLEKLEKKLYSRKSSNVSHSDNRTEFSQEEKDLTSVNNWQKNNNGKFDEMAFKFARATSNSHGIVKKLFTLSLIFFVVASLVALFVFWKGGNLISSENVDIKVVAPLSVAAGQEVSFDIGIINTNNTSLESVSMLVEYPLGTRAASSLKELNSERFNLGSIKAGEQISQKMQAVFYGDKGSVKDVKISLEYRVENSSALFFKEKNHEFSISSAPIIVTPIYPKEVNSNQDVTFNIEVVSNANEPVGDLLLKVEYPFGFVYGTASQAPLDRDNVWTLPTLKQGEKKTISIKGTMIGQDNEEKSFRVYVGTKNSNDEREIDVALAELTETMLIKKPFLGLTVSIDGNSGDYAARNGQDVDVKFTIRNNLPSRVFNIKADAVISGGALDKNKVEAGSGGFFRSVDNTLIWDDRSLSNLRDLGPGEAVSLEFNFTPLDYSKISKSERPEINIDFNIKGERVLESGTVENVNAFEKRKVALTTNLNINQKIVRSLGNIENSGPIPPKVDTPTTYTVMWNITNTFNQTNNVEVRATLPQYVRFTNLKNPNDDTLTYNPLSNEVVWNAGTVLSNTGFSSPPKEAYFQIEFIPSTSQVGATPILVSEATLQGRDRVTDVVLVNTSPAVTTNFSGDPTYKAIDGRVSP